MSTTDSSPAPRPLVRLPEGLVREARALALVVGVFLLAFFLPVDRLRVTGPVLESLVLVHDYARQHVLLCLAPAFLVAGAIGVFVRKGAVMRCLGADAHPVVAYGVAAVSGGVLAVCSCTVLPLFAGIHRRGAGLGPATAFLYAGPAINVLAIVLTARVLGLELGLARAIGAVGFSVVIGVLMHLAFRQEERARAAAVAAAPAVPDDDRPVAPAVALLALLVGILVFANWGAPASAAGLGAGLHAAKWPITAALGVALAFLLGARFGAPRGRLVAVAAVVAAAAFFGPGRPLVPFVLGTLGVAWIATAPADGDPRREDLGEWIATSWGFARQILPLLLVGVLIAGALMGRPGSEGLVPSRWIAASVGGNSPAANLFAAVAGALMYFATLTEIPILQGLIANGMGGGPALALLLAGPALSLPNMLVIRSVLGTRKTVVYVGLVVALSAVAGLVYGAFAAPPGGPS